MFRSPAVVLLAVLGVYAGVLLTGATGFVGQAILERLLTSHPGTTTVSYTHLTLPTSDLV